MKKMIWPLVIGAAAAGLGLYLSRGPWEMYLKQRRSSAENAKEMAAAESERNELIRQKAKYESAIGKEELARSRNFKRAEEVRLEDR